MRIAGLQGRHRRRRQVTTIPDPRSASRPDLVVRDFAPDPDGLDTRWCGDITYLPTEEGWLYPATVIDIASRRVVGWSTADRPRTDLVADALRSACRRRRPSRPVIFHSGCGCQYTSQQFATLAGEFRVRPSVGRTGQCWDNALAGPFFATIKRELLDTRPWPSRAAARTAIFDFIEGWYNLHRLHSSLGHRGPAEHGTALAARPPHRRCPSKRNKLSCTQRAVGFRAQPILGPTGHRPTTMPPGVSHPREHGDVPCRWQPGKAVFSTGQARLDRSQDRSRHGRRRPVSADCSL
jgi:transposase InsO family protein